MLAIMDTLSPEASKAFNYPEAIIQDGIFGIGYLKIGAIVSKG